MSTMWKDCDLEQIAASGITIEEVEKQIEQFRQGFPKSKLVEAATVENGGIKQLTDKQISHYSDYYQQASKSKKIMKFVPASGAATRMFKDLYSFASQYFGVAQNFEYEYPTVAEFLKNIRTFAFFDDLRACMDRSSLDIVDYLQRGDYSTIINYLLKEQYLGYGHLPKALLKFHRYGEVSRTPLEEHIVEGAHYAQESDGSVHIHFTVSPEHRPLFKKKIAEIRRYYEASFNIRLKITLSEQKHYTDTIAVDEYNVPIRDEEGRLVFRPGGHGALIENLNECRADIFFLKNIDNVAPDWLKHTTIIYKEALGGMLLEIQKQCHEYLRQLHTSQTSPTLIQKAKQFATEQLNIYFDKDFNQQDEKAQIATLKTKLNRPIRVCGMVRNQGEPGGGPFFVENNHGIKSLQIVETAQINRKDPNQEAILGGSTHFNPVDLVCATKDWRGRYFDLRKFVDPTTGFISKKSKGAQTVKSQELPGLWNGAMADWITIFVEVPLATFNPVKTVNDLLRKEHLEN